MVKSKEIVKAGSSIPGTIVLGRRGWFRGVRASLEGNGGAGSILIRVYDGLDNTGPLIWTLPLDAPDGQTNYGGLVHEVEWAITVGTGIFIDGTTVNADPVDVVAFYAEEL